jgi:hypothetical protein
MFKHEGVISTKYHPLKHDDMDIMADNERRCIGDRER